MMMKPVLGSFAAGVGPTALTLALAVLVYAVPAAEPAPPTPAQGKLPAAKEVIDKFIKAAGGREAWLKHRSLHAKGTMEMPAQGVKGQVELFLAAPSNHLVKMDIPNMGQIQTGCDGSVGWSLDPIQGPRLLEGKELEQLLAESDFRGPLHDEKSYKSMETIEEAPFEGRPCYKLKLVRLSGEEVFEYFDVATGLSAGTSLKQQTPMGIVPVTQVSSDYKKFGDLLIATKSIQKMLGLEQVITLDSVEFDDVKETVFELPPKIKALLKK
jgi:hypothetical protein